LVSCGRRCSADLVRPGRGPKARTRPRKQDPSNRPTAGTQLPGSNLSAPLNAGPRAAVAPAFAAAFPPSAAIAALEPAGPSPCWPTPPPVRDVTLRPAVYRLPGADKNNKNTAADINERNKNVKTIRQRTNKEPAKTGSRRGYGECRPRPGFLARERAGPVNHPPVNGKSVADALSAATQALLPGHAGILQRRRGCILRHGTVLPCESRSVAGWAAPSFQSVLASLPPGALGTSLPAAVTGGRAASSG